MWHLVLSSSDFLHDFLNGREYCNNRGAGMPNGTGSAIGWSEHASCCWQCGLLGAKPARSRVFNLLANRHNLNHNQLSRFYKFCRSSTSRSCGLSTAPFVVAFSCGKNADHRTVTAATTTTTTTVTMGEEKASSVEVIPGQVALKKQITLFQSVAIIVGIIIGSGIFVSPVGIMIHVKSVGMSLVMWGLCGLYNTLCALCYAELGASIPQSGGEYIYIKRAFGDYPAFMCLWINFLLIAPVGIAALSLIASLYILQPIFPDCMVPALAEKFIAVVIVCFLVMINTRNVKWVTRLQVVITSSKLIALAIIIVIGFVYLGKGNVESFEDAFGDSDFSGGAIALSFYSGFWAYSGWSYLNFLTEELVEPHKNLPRAIMISMCLVIVVYLVANVAYLGVLSPEQMTRSTAVAVTFAELTMGVMQWLMPVLIGISVLGTINGTILSMSRLFFIGAQNNHMPLFMSMIQYKYLTPATSLFVILSLSLCFQMSGDIWYLIEMEGFGFATVLSMVFAGQVYLRYKEPNLHRPIKVPIVLPAILFLVSLAIVGLTFYQKVSESLTALLILAIGTVLYLLGNRWTTKPKSIQSKINAVNLFLQKLFLVVPQDDPDSLDWD
ncbi:large neutral amino acids transporter small subunit 1-like [Babylonia areolata]|uniref:large neutral amino acids transporter small subunit 1-like n=1 Tax=Babylonia areolata TaxID=304850 RepID=UPI003FD47B92